MKRLFTLILLSFFLIVACSHQEENQTVIKIGTISGPESELMETAKRVADKDYHISIKIVPFSDYIMPNVALNDKSIDANVYQHEPYLKTAIALHGYPFTSIAKTFIYPMAMYSKKLNSLDNVPDNAIIGIPNDPSNGARALLLMDKAGLIKLKEGVGIKATVNDILYNPKHFTIKELDAAQLSRALTDVDLAVINTNYALPAGLYPKKDGLFIESVDSPYANIVVVRTENKDDPKFKTLIKVLHSPEVLEKAKTLFQDQAIPAW